MLFTSTFYLHSFHIFVGGTKNDAHHVFGVWCGVFSVEVFFFSLVGEFVIDSILGVQVCLVSFDVKGVVLL